MTDRISGNALAAAGAFLRRLDVVQTSLAIWYAVFTAWGVANLVYPPSDPLGILGGLFLFVAAFAALSGTVAVGGALLVRQPQQLGTIGLLVEQLGLLGLQAANVCYLFTIVALAVGLPGHDWFARIFYCFGVSCALGVRQSFLLPKYRAIGTAPEAHQVIVH